MLIFIGPCLNLQWTALHALRSSLGEMRFSELINNGGKEIKRRKKKSINDRKPVFKLYIMYYSATCNLSSDRCHCSIWHMYKRRKCRIRKRLSYHFWRGCYYFITVSTAVPPTVWLWKDSLLRRLMKTWSGVIPAPTGSWLGYSSPGHTPLLGGQSLSSPAHKTLSMFLILSRCSI